MNISASGKVLSTATTNLFRQWAHAREDWRDSKSDDFERKYLLELQVSVDRAGAVLEQIQQIMKQVREDCE